MHDGENSINCNCAATHPREPPRLQQFNFTVRRKSRKKHQPRKTSSMPIETTSTTNYDSRNYNNFNKVNKSLITSLLLITLVAAATISQAHGAAIEAAQQQQQQRQLQQQQLFAMLSRNKQRDEGSKRSILSEDEDDEAEAGGGLSLVRTKALRTKSALQPAVASFSETSGFVADDGQQYEKAQKALAAAAAATTNSVNPSANNCPKECKCLNDYFDCGKKHLERVPALPNYVQILDLIGNKLNDTSVLQIRNLPDLHKLTLKRNMLYVIPKFVGLNELKQLNLANNRIEQIANESLAALPKLKALDLSRNYLHTLQANYFPTGNKIAHLILNYNEIGSIDEDAFTHMSDLLDLELNNNRLVSLPGGIFKNLAKLKKLSLDYNHLEINWSTFKGLFSLQKLFLRSNNIRALQDGVFHVMRSIETIELDDNSITSLSRQGLFNLTKLHHLSLSNNSISRIELDTFEFTQSLISLDLSRNNISEFKPQHLECLLRLRHLDLGHNKIQYLAENTFDCVKNLEDLNLRRNKLAWIVEDPAASPPFKALRKLKKLDLFGNHLKQLNGKSLIGLNSLELLNLGGNALASIQSGAFEHTANLQRLELKSTNFICDCELLWFRRWLQEYAQKDADAQLTAVCGYPKHLEQRKLMSLTEKELICADSPKPVISQEPSNQLAVKGANITMECIANSPNFASALSENDDELRIKWRHDNHNIKSERDRAPPLSHSARSTMHSYSTTETQVHYDQKTNQSTLIGYLRLYNVSYENAGKYQCVVSNSFGTTYSQKFKISIGIHPTFLQTPVNLTIDSGDTARVVCSATGDPTPEISLHKFGASDFPAAKERRLQVIREENAFVITNAKPIDTGIYTCNAESAAGEIRINASLIVNDKPQPTIPLVRKEVELGESSVLECLNEMATALNRPHREWFKDNKPFHTSSTSDSERYYFTSAKELLVIVKTQSMDAGHYRCELKDNSKTFTMQIELIVVKEYLSQSLIIVGIVLVTIICIALGTLFVCSIRWCQKRKAFHNHHQNLLGSGASGSNARVAASQHMLNSSHVSGLDHTQLTTLNRTVLQAHDAQQRRPRSLTDLDYKMGNHNVDPEQRNCLIVSTTPRPRQNNDHHRRRPGEVDGDDIASYTLEFLHSDTPTHDHQDHLSSKDSGTGSDAAVKLGDDAHAMHAAVLAKTDTYTDEDDEEETLKTCEVGYKPALGVSEYEMELYQLSPGQRHAYVEPEHAHLGHWAPRANYVETNLMDAAKSSSAGNGEKPPQLPQQQRSIPNTKCKTNLSTNFNVNNATSQAVDI